MKYCFSIIFVLSLYNINAQFNQMGADLEGVNAHDFFGGSTALSSDGSVLAVATFVDDITAVDLVHDPEISTIMIYNLQGQLIWEKQTIGHSQLKILSSEIGTGTFLLKAVSEMVRYQTVYQRSDTSLCLQ